MNNIIDTSFYSPRTWKSSNETNPIVISNDIQGGVHSFQNKNVMDEYIANKGNVLMLEYGMLGYDIAAEKTYQLVSANTAQGNPNGVIWKELESGGGGGETPKFESDAVYFVSTESTYLTDSNLPTGNTKSIDAQGNPLSAVSGYTATTDMTHSFDCSVFTDFDDKKGYIYFALPIYNKENNYFFTINGNIINSYSSTYVTYGNSNSTLVLYRLDNKLGGRKIVLNVQKED